jgi:hypothetical protein
MWPVVTENMYSATKLSYGIWSGPASWIIHLCILQTGFKTFIVKCMAGTGIASWCLYGYQQLTYRTTLSGKINSESCSLMSECSVCFSSPDCFKINFRNFKDYLCSLCISKHSEAQFTRSQFWTKLYLTLYLTLCTMYIRPISQMLDPVWVLWGEK